VDGAARVVDPIIVGINTSQHVWGTVPQGLSGDGLVARWRSAAVTEVHGGSRGDTHEAACASQRARRQRAVEYRLRR
jgi:hypothetical protein